MRGHSLDRNIHQAPVEKVVVTHSWLPYSLLSILYVLGGLGWFGTMLATVSYTTSSTITNNNNGISFLPAMTSAFFGFINLYLFRMLCLFAALATTYYAERHYLSRGAAWTSWSVNLLLLFSWLATDLPFVYSSFSYFSDNGANNANGANTNTNNGANGFPNDSFRTHYCSVSSSFWCDINYTHAVFSVYAGALLALTWMWSCYQLKRARGVSNLLLTWPEVLLINLSVFGIIGYIIWTCSTINLATTRNFNVFSYLEGQQQLNTYRMQWSNLIWGNYLIHAAFIASLAASAYVSFGATTAPRMTALIMNWLSFFCIFPAFVYLARNQNDIGQCNGSYTNSSLRCPSLDGVAAGMGICAAINLLQGLTMFALLAQVETADFAVDMYGDKARAIDDARSTGTLPMKDLAQPAPLTSIGTGIPMQPMYNQPAHYAQAPIVA